MLPFVNPNYFNQPQYQPMYQMPQPQPQTQPQPQYQSNQFVLQGKVVESMDVVKATDIPMDGQTYYFPKADGSGIFSKTWLPNGTTKVTSYLPQIEPKEDKPNNLPLNTLESRFDALNDATDGIREDLNKLISEFNKLNKPTRSKKVDADEC